jgi:hypothetical protein
LRVQVNKQRLAAVTANSGSKIESRCRFSDTTLLVEYCNAHRHSQVGALMYKALFFP